LEWLEIRGAEAILHTMSLGKAAHFFAKPIELGAVKFTPELVGCIPKQIALRYRVLPVFKTDCSLGVALADPADLDTIDSLGHLLKCEIEIRVAEPRQLEEYIQRCYG
jgi:hypothetical protein